MAKTILHGKRCNWILKGDYVLNYRRGEVAEFDRLWECDDCRLERRRLYTRYPRWTRGPLRYKGRHVPLDERISDEEAIRSEIAETTTNPEIKKAVKGK